MSVPGMVIADRYRLVRQVGSGGMGVVWEAMDERLGRPVAVKQLRAQVGLTEVEAELAKNRAMREARITARLHHRYAVPVFDVVEHEGGPCLIMQFLPSMPLSAVLREGGPLTVEETTRVGAQVASALAAAHQLRIVHRDVKPGNILITDDGSALISDFGISHALGDATLTSTGMVHGTPAYLAPEVARGNESSFASDVYSLGGTLYAALEGSPPFGTDSNSIALLHRVATGQIVPPSRTGALTPLVTSMLSADPEARPSMQQVATSLGALAAPQGVAGPADNLDAATLPMVPPTAAAPARPATTPAPAPASGPAAALAAATVADGVPPARTAPPARGDKPPPPRRRTAAALVLTLALLAAAALGGAALLDGRFGSVPTAAERPSGPAGASESGQPSSDAPSKPSSAPATTASSAPSSAGPTPKPSPKPKATATAKKDDDEDDDDDDDGPPRAAELARAVSSYYALMPGDTDAAWRRLTSGYQSGHAGGRSAFENFWGDVSRVSVSGVSGAPPDQAQATVTYVYRNGRVVREQTAYRLVEEEGRLKIAASTVLSSTG